MSNSKEETKVAKKEKTASKEIKSFSEVKFNKSNGEFINDPNLIFMDEILKEKGMEKAGLKIYEESDRVFSSLNDFDDFPLSTLLEFYNANPQFYWEEIDNKETMNSIFDIVDQFLKSKETNLLEKLGVDSLDKIEKIFSVSPNNEDSMPFLVVLSTKDQNKNLLVIVNFKWGDSESVDQEFDFDKEVFEHQIISKEEFDLAQTPATDDSESDAEASS
jgi:hypothetical protein